jgi:hypothetical protein
MSFSKAPDRPILGRVAGALAVDEAFVEKDWFVVQAIKVLVTLGHEGLTRYSRAARLSSRDTS